MDKYRLLLGVLFVTLSWSCMQTYAQSTTTATSPGANATTPGANATTPGANATTPGANATTPGANATTQGTMGTTQGPMTTTQGTMATTQGAITTAPGANNPTTPAVTTTPAPLATNTSVETLATTVNRNECGKTQLCAAEPSTCDPSAGASCFFLGAQKKDGNNFEFALSGESDGYIAASVLSPVNNKEVTYICANKNNAVKFFGAVLENGGLTIRNVSANSVKGKVNGKKIQCTFLATVPDTDIKAAPRARRATDVTLSVSTGPFDASSDSPGAPTRVIKAAVADLANANITVSNDITNSTNTTTAPTTNTTTAPTTTTTTAPTSAVGSLQTDLNSTDCGSGKLCASEPKSCNPATGDTCSFLSAKQKSGQIYSFELSGLSDGYIASAVSTDTTAGNGDSTYVCANNNGVVKFITAIFNNNNLTETSLNVTSGSVYGKIKGRQIQCVFEATLPDTTTRAATYSMIVMNGSYNPAAVNPLGQPLVLVRTNLVNLSDPTANTTNLASGVAPHYHPLMQALLITFGILVLTMFGH